uniref:Uncharacterized protein n=1 Tax=Chaetoceros debilis TaxID=122233 RepID=A0A7S3V5W9_9STRA
MMLPIRRQAFMLRSCATTKILWSLQSSQLASLSLFQIQKERHSSSSSSRHHGVDAAASVFSSPFASSNSVRNFHHGMAAQQAAARDGDDATIIMSPTFETPLDSTVMEKPYTLILMEDPTPVEKNDITSDSTSSSTSRSWEHDFQSKVPNDCGMSFASLAYDSKNVHGSKLTLAQQLQALKASPLSSIHDAILVTRGPLSSLMAQYYLESLSLQGLVMIDPILIDDDENITASEGNDNDSVANFVTSTLMQSQEDMSMHMFQSSRLLVEANSVPMMVMTSKNDARWNEASKFVANRHSDEDGIYGIVPIVDLADNDCYDDGVDRELKEVIVVLDHIHDWIDEFL